MQRIYGDDFVLLGSIAIIVVLVLLNAFLAAAEIAFLSVNPNKVRISAETGNRKAELLQKTIHDPSKFLATIQVGISLVGLFSGAFAATAFAGTITDMLVNLGFPIPYDIINMIVIILITITLSYFSIVVGELVPKNLANKRPEKIAYFAVNHIYRLSLITTPVVKLLSFSTNMILKLIGVDPKDKALEATEEEIRLLADAGGQDGSIDVMEREMIHNIFEFDNKNIGEIGTHRKDIVAVDADLSRDEVISITVGEGYSRLPVYRENIDNIVGILHLKDLMQHVFETKNRSQEEFDIMSIVREPYFVPFSKKTDQLFEEMKRRKIYLAIVVDEYGGTEGLVTMEDLIEEIVGSIYDEYDEESQEIDKIDANTFHVDGTASLDTISEMFKVDLPTDEYETLGGFLVGQLGRIPAEGEQPEVEFNGLLFKVYKVEDNRVVSVVVCVIS